MNDERSIWLGAAYDSALGSKSCKQMNNLAQKCAVFFVTRVNISGGLKV